METSGIYIGGASTNTILDALDVKDPWSHHSSGVSSLPGHFRSPRVTNWEVGTKEDAMEG